MAAELPDWVVAIAGLVTQLGDMWFVVAGVIAVFVFGLRREGISEHPRRDALYLLALVMGSFAVTYALKDVFGLPRPPAAGTATIPVWLPVVLGGVYESLVTGDGFGFPSGHALKTTVVYGGAALTLTVWERRDRLLAAGAVTVLVAGSRVVLGVHYLVDVVAGIGIGVVFLVAVDRATDGNPRPALLVAIGVGFVAIVLTASVNAVLATAVAVGGLVLWETRWASS